MIWHFSYACATHAIALAIFTLCPITTHTPAANHNQGEWGQAHKQHGQEKRKAPPTTTTPPGRDGKPTTADHTAKRGAGRKGPTGDTGEGPNLRGLAPPPGDRIGPT